MYTNNNEGGISMGKDALKVFYIAFTVMLALSVFFGGAPALLLLAAAVCIPLWNIIDGFLDDEGLFITSIGDRDDNAYDQPNIFKKIWLQITKSKKMREACGEAYVSGDPKNVVATSKELQKHALFDYVMLGALSTGTLTWLAIWIHNHAATIQTIASMGTASIMHALPLGLQILMGPVGGAMFAMTMCWTAYKSWRKVNLARKMGHPMPKGAVLDACAWTLAGTGASVLAIVGIIAMAANPVGLGIVTFVGVGITIAAATLKLVQLVISLCTSTNGLDSAPIADPAVDDNKQEFSPDPTTSNSITIPVLNQKHEDGGDNAHCPPGSYEDFVDLEFCRVRLGQSQQQQSI
jgi:hypothetical protein